MKVNEEVLKLIAIKVWGDEENAVFKKVHDNEVTFKCPICGDSKRNPKKHRMYFNTDTGVGICFNCGWTGTIKKLLETLKEEEIIETNEYEKLIFSVIKDKLNSNEKTIDSIKEQPEDFPEGISLQTLKEHIKEIKKVKEKYLIKINDTISYLKQRGVKKEFYKYFFVPLDENRFKNYVLLLYQVDGKWYFQANNIYGGKPKYLHQKHGRKGLAFEELISKNKDDRLFVVEGYYDALALNQEGYNAVCVFGSNEMRWSSPLLKYKDDYDVIFIPDFDHTFKQVVNKLYRQDERTKIMIWDPGYKYKDINEAYIKEKNFKKWLEDNVIISLLKLAHKQKLYQMGVL